MQVRDANLFMTFKYNGSDHPTSFGYVISQKAFDTFVVNNNVGRFAEQDVQFPDYLMHGSTRRALVHTVNEELFACYVPVFPTQAETDEYSAAFGR